MAELADVAGAHVGVAVEGGFSEALGLDFAGGDEALADCDRRFAGEALVGHFVLLEAGDFDVDVDAVEEGALRRRLKPAFFATFCRPASVYTREYYDGFGTILLVDGIWERGFFFSYHVYVSSRSASAARSTRTGLLTSGQVSLLEHLPTSMPWLGFVHTLLVDDPKATLPPRQQARS